MKNINHTTQKYACRLLLLLILIFIGNKSKAQTASTYIFSASAGTYTPITGGTVLSFGTIMDDRMFSVTIPSFTYLGTAYTQVYADENGYIQFGATSPTTTMRTYLSSAEVAAKSGISGYSKDLSGKSASAELRTQTIGSEVIFQWKDMSSFGATAQTVTFQIRLNTTTNAINVVYNMSATAGTTAEVGLRGSVTDFNNRTSTTSWTASAAGTVNSATMTLSNTVFPAPGQTYTWTPPPPCTGKPSGGTLASAAGTTAICPNATTILTVTGATVATGIVYEWDSSTVAAAGPWLPIPGAIATTYSGTAAPCATVYYRRRTICTASGLSEPSTTVSVSVKCATVPPYFEDFESITVANTLPNCMTATNLGTLVNTMLAGADRNRINHTTTPGASKFAYFRFGCNDFLFTPALILNAGKMYELSFWYITDGTPFDSLILAYGSTPDAAGMINKLPSIGKIANTTYTRYKTLFTARTSGIQYIGINCKATSVPWYLTVDDISLQEVPPCKGIPVTGAAGADPLQICGTGSTILNLPALAPALGYTYVWQDSTAGGSWGNDIGRPSYGGTDLSFTSGPIAVNTYFRCIVKCTISGDSSISAPVLVKAGAFEIPYVQDFESISVDNELPPCMTATSINPYVQTFRAPMANNRKNNTPGGSKYACFRWGSDDYLFSPPINFIGGQEYILSFSYITDGLNGWNTLRANIGTAPSATTMSRRLKSITNPKNTDYVQYADTFTMPSSGIYYFGIYCSANSVPFYLSIDDINLQYRPCAGPPAAGAVTSAFPSGTGVCPGTKVRLSNNGGTASFIPGIRYQWQRKAIVSTAGWQDITGANDSVLFADTLGGYEYRVGIVCTNTNDSSFSAPYALPMLQVHPPVSIAPALSPVNYCFGDTVTLIASNFAGTVYDWIKNGAVIPGWKFNNLSATDPGTYSVKVSSAAYPCPAYSNIVKLVANDPGYTVKLSAPADSIICSGAKVLLTGTASKPGVAYQWRKNNVPISAALSNTYLADASGDYSLTASDGLSSCAAFSRTIRITVNPAPPAVITVPGVTTTGCEGVGVRLDANPLPSFSYQWSRNGTLVVSWTDSSMTALQSGTYVVKVRTPAGCVSVSEPVVVTILPSPAPVIAKSGFVLGVTTPYASYQWFRNGSIMTGRTNDTLHLTRKGIYKVRVTDANGCIGVSIPVEVNDTGLDIHDIHTEAAEIKIYPNPTDGKITVESSVSLYIEVKDVTGKTIINSKEVKEIDLGKYPDGLYLLLLRDKEQLLKQVRVTKVSR